MFTYSSEMSKTSSCTNSNKFHLNGMPGNTSVDRNFFKYSNLTSSFVKELKFSKKKNHCLLRIDLTHFIVSRIDSLLDSEFFFKEGGEGLGRWSFYLFDSFPWFLYPRFPLKTSFVFLHRLRLLLCFSCL